MMAVNYRNIVSNIAGLLDLLDVLRSDKQGRPLNVVYRMHLLYDEVRNLRQENERLRGISDAVAEAERIAAQTGTAVIIVKGLSDGNA